MTTALVWRRYPSSAEMAAYELGREWRRDGMPRVSPFLTPHLALRWHEGYGHMDRALELVKEASTRA